jgi:hypothetical protein
MPLKAPVFDINRPFIPNTLLVINGGLGYIVLCHYVISIIDGFPSAACLAVQAYYFLKPHAKETATSVHFELQ